MSNGRALKPKKNQKDIQNLKTGYVPPPFLFSKKNYLLLIIGFSCLIIGFILLSGGGEEGYMYSEEIFSLRRRVFAPIIIIIALILCGISIMKKK